VLDLVTVSAKPDDVVGTIAHACQRRKVTPAQLQIALQLRKKMPHRDLVAQALAAIADGVESVLEWRYFRDVERAHGLPKGRRQVVRRRGGRREVVDVEYAKYKVIVELDGETFHVGEQRRRDKARDNAAAARGEIALRYGWSDATFTPCASAWQIGAVLQQRGWKGAVRCCRRCRASGFGAVGGIRA
jgi:very-short-patch-repair endonuclease